MEVMMDAWKFTEFKACDISSSIFRMGDFGKIMLFPQACRRELGVVLQRHNLRRAIQILFHTPAIYLHVELVPQMILYPIANSIPYHMNPVEIN
ncbi:hypothetical protein CFP56_016723 [Quercus suber]|uniref:Uncharacterized protein n=1 Tax=Quercus suber TaxID=58331 RepID=A0AAW0KPY4_QUESU